MIFFCIPVYNEEKTAGVVLWKIRQVMAEFPRDYQILLADDASTDGTAKVIDPYRRVLPLILMRSHRRRGYAAALEMLIREAARRSRYPRRDMVVIMQADFSEDADDVPSLLRRMESGADLAVGGPVATAGRPGLLERTTERIVRNLLRRKTWPEPLTEPLVGFSAIRLACIRKAIDEAADTRLLRWEGRTANAALLGAVAPHARRIDAIEMTLHPERRQRPRRSSPLGTLREVWRFVHDRAASDLEAPDALVPDEVHGDLSALHRHENGADEKRKTAPRRPPRKATDATGDRPKRRRTRPAEGEQPGDAARKERKPRRPRRKPKPAAAGDDGTGPADTAGLPEAPAAADGETAASPAPKRRRGSRGGARKRKRPNPAATEGATEGAATEPRTDGDAGPPDGAGTDAEATTNGPPKRRRRGGRSRSGRRPKKEGGQNEATGDAPAESAAPPPQQKDGEGQ